MTNIGIIMCGIGIAFDIGIIVYHLYKKYQQKRKVKIKEQRITITRMGEVYD